MERAGNFQFRSSQRFSRNHHVSMDYHTEVAPPRPASAVPVVQNMDAIFSRASTSAARYVSDSSAENTNRLDESLSDVIRYISDLEAAARLSLKSQHVVELLRYTSFILNASTTNAITRSRFYRLLFNIALHNIPIRKFMACELELCASIFNCLKISLREELGPQNMIDILRLLQVLSYEKTVELGVWTNELISFLILEVIREPEQEWMPYCIAILCNLATRSKSVCRRIKKSTSYKKFANRVLTLLQHKDRIIVVSSLVLIGYLEEKVRDMVYCTSNIHETFQCVFNVLLIGDGECMMTRQIAADLLRRLIVSDTPAVSSVPTLATTGKDVLNYGLFKTWIQQTSELLVTLDPRMEESVKIYDLLLSFCSLQILRSPVCQSIIRCSPTESRLTTPILAIAKTAALSTYDAINGEVPLKSLKLLTFLLREIVEPNEKVVPFMPVSQIVSLVGNSVQTRIDIDDDDVALACRRVQLGFRLAEVCARDEDIRNKLLDICTAQLCHHIADFQFSHNPVVLHLTRPPLQRDETLAEWSMEGIGIVLELCRLLAVLKDHSKLHKDQYWQLLKDERLIPFLAYAVTYGDHELVRHAFVTYSHCAQVHQFQSQLLAEMVASCTVERRMGMSSSKNIEKVGSNSQERVERPGSADQDERSLKALDELLRRISIEGCNLRDAKTSEILAVFERKIGLMRARERDLEALVKAKDEALMQSEKLRLQYGCGSAATKSFGSDVDISRMRLVMQENEDIREENEKLKNVMDVLRMESEKNVEESDRMRKEIKLLSASCEELQRKVDRSAINLGDVQSRMRELEQEKENMASEFRYLQMEIEKAKKENDAEIVRLNADVAQKVTRIEQFMQENNDLKRQFEEKLAECEAIKEHVARSDERYQVKEKELGRVHNLLGSLEQRLNGKEKECSAAMNQIGQYEERLSVKERESADSLTTIRSLREELEQSKMELRKLERMREAMLSLAAER